MVARKILDENPLDLIVPKRAGPPKKAKAGKHRAKPRGSTASKATGQGGEPSGRGVQSTKPVKLSKPSRSSKSAQPAKRSAKKKVDSKPSRQAVETAPPVEALSDAAGTEPSALAARPQPLPSVAGKAKKAPSAGGQAATDHDTGGATDSSQWRQPSDRHVVTAQAGQYLTFFMGGEEYGAGILKVKEIIEFDSLTKVPMTPPWIRGVLNLRGSVVAVVDLAVKFGLPPSEISDRTCVVIVEIDSEVEKSVMGIIVDAVSQVVEFSADEIEPPPAFGTRVHVEYLQGMGKLDDKFVLLIDTDRILAAEELMEVSALERDEADGESTEEASSEVADPGAAEPGEASPSDQ